MNTIYLLFSLVIVIFIISIFKHTEGFVDSPNIFNIDSYFIQNIVPLANPKDTGYIVTAINPNKINVNHLYKIFSLKNITSKENHNSYKPLKNGKIDDKTIIVHLLWYHDELDNEYKSIGKKLMCVGLKHIIEGNKKKPIYTIYYKESKNIESKWKEFVMQHPDRAIKSIIYDLNDNLLGIDYRDNQIYQLDETNESWNGPINYSDNIQIHKLLFSIEKKMIAIDINGKIHKHDSVDWKNTPWVKLDKINEEFNNAKKEYIFFDMIYDQDGKFIAFSKNTNPNDTNKTTLILKQYVNQSQFVDYFNDPKVNKVIPSQDKILSINDIIMYKTGIDSNKFDYLTLDDESKIKNTSGDKELQRKTYAMINLNHYLKIKRTLLQKCKNFRNSFSKKTLKKHDINSNISVYNTIETIIDELDQKYDGSPSTIATSSNTTT